ncbi:MAG: aminoacyl-tRNA hydrolase [Armatimonadota bacterium]|nr:aminoacyl-tRNA hydrolase [Armatimonadota bacterium]
MKLIVGMGNPGRRYAHTRHNVGFDVVDLIAKRHHVRVLRRSCRALVGQALIAGEEVVLAKPQTFMNLSGDSVSELARRMNIAPQDIIVIYDDADLPIGKIRIRPMGSSGGHKGMKSIIDRLHTQEFPRIRIGIGAMKGNSVDYVLSRFSRAELALVKPAIEKAADAVETILAEGMEPAINEYNRAQVDD